MRIKRFRQAAITGLIALCLLGLLPAAVQGEGKGFTDVARGYWAYDAIVWAEEQGVVSGYPDGTFKPDQFVNQTEFLAMLINTYLDKDQLPREDSSHWGAPYMQHAFKMGWGSSIITPPASKLSEGDPNYKYYYLETRMNAAMLIANANGRNYSYDDSIRFLLDRGLAVGKTDKSIEGFKGRDYLTRAEAVTLIRNLKKQQDMLYPCTQWRHPYDPTTLQLSPFEIYPLQVDRPSNDSLLRYSNLTLTAPTAGYTLVPVPSFTITGTVSEIVGENLTIQVEYWDKGFFQPVTTITAPITDGKLSTAIDLSKYGVYRMTVTSEYEREGHRFKQHHTLTSFYVEYKTKDSMNLSSIASQVRAGDLKIVKNGNTNKITGKLFADHNYWDALYASKMMVMPGSKVDIKACVAFYDDSSRSMAKVPITVSSIASGDQIEEFEATTEHDVSAYSFATLEYVLPEPINAFLPPNLNVTDKDGMLAVGQTEVMKSGEYTKVRVEFGLLREGLFRFEGLLTYYDESGKVLGTAEIKSKGEGSINVEPGERIPIYQYETAGKGDLTKASKFTLALDVFEPLSPAEFEDYPYK